MKNLFQNKTKDLLVLIFFILLVVLLRWSSFYRSLIDWDESLYLLVSQAWSEGNPPYTTIWDNKPPGIYAIFLIAISVFGHSVLSIRIFACIFVIITCFFLYKIGSLIESKSTEIGLLSGSLYAIATIRYGGLASNTEIFFTTFVVIAFFLFFSANILYMEKIFLNHNLTFFQIGLLLGIGFEIKYVVLFDFLALSLILVFTMIAQTRLNAKYWLILKNICFLSLGFVLPFIIVSLYFWLIGNFDDYIYANFTANKLRTVYIEFSFVTPLKFFFQIDKMVWFSIPFLSIYLFIAKTIPTRDRWILSSFIISFFTTLLCLSSLLRGYFYSHYFLQFLPSICFVSAYIIIKLAYSGIKLEKSKFRKYQILVAFLILLINTTGIFKALYDNANYVYFRQVKGIRQWGDTPALIAEYLKDRIKANDYIYIMNDIIIVYFLASAKIPTRYAFPGFMLIQADLPNITGIDPLEELDLILQKQPVYIIKRSIYKDIEFISRNKKFLDKIDQTLEQNYQIETSIDGFNLYRLN